MTLKKNILALRQKKAIVQKGGGDKAIEKQVAMGKMTARDRILALLDEDSFHEYDMFVEHEERNFGMAGKELPGDGVITGTGTINNAPVCIYAQDFTVMGGSLGLKHARKITKIMDHALKMKMPCIGINDSGGARIQEGIGALAGYGEIFYRNTMASGGYSPDFGNSWPVCWWSGLLSGSYRLCFCGGKHFENVYYRS